MQDQDPAGSLTEIVSVTFPSGPNGRCLTTDGNTLVPVVSSLPGFPLTKTFPSAGSRRLGLFLRNAERAKAEDGRPSNKRSPGERFPTLKEIGVSRKEASNGERDSFERKLGLMMPIQFPKGGNGSNQKQVKSSDSTLAKAGISKFQSATFS